MGAMGLVFIGIGVALGWLALTRTDELVLTILLVAAAIFFVAMGVVAAAPRVLSRLGTPVTVTAVVAIFLFIGILGVTALISPDTVITSPGSFRGPRTDTEARIMGVILIVVCLAPLYGLRGRRPSETAHKKAPHPQ